MVIFGPPNTLGHSPKARLVVTTVNRHAKRDPVSATKRDAFRGALGMTARRADVARLNLGRSRAAERLPGVQ